MVAPARTLSITVTIVFMLIALTVSAQDGRWVRYDLSTIDCYDGGMPARGDGLVCLAPASSHYFLVFDISVGSWLTVDLGPDRTFVGVESEGHVAYGFAEDLLFAYSDLTASWDTTAIGGTLLQSEACGGSGNLAYYLTDERLYVFDAAIAEWISYDYTLPSDYTFSWTCARDDYIAVMLGRTHPEPPTLAEVAVIMERHLDMLLELYAPRKVIAYFRKFCVGYCRRHPQRRQSLLALMAAGTVEQVKEAIKEWFLEYTIAGIS